MAKLGKFSASDLKKLQRKLNKVQDSEIDAFIKDCAKELAARLLAKVIKRTPVGDYSKQIEVTAKRNSKKHKKGETYLKTVNPSGKKGGTLRRGWTSETYEQAASGKGTTEAQYAQSLTINHIGDMYTVDIINPVEYASYVEFGHRTRNHKGWVPGRFMLTISEQEIQDIAPNVLKAKVEKYLKGML